MKLFYLLFFGVACVAVAKEEEDLINYWEKFWEVNENVKLSDVSRSNSSWVKCYGSYLSQKQSDQEAERRKIALFNLMKKLVVTSYRSREAVDLEFIRDLFLLEEKLEIAGGYNNKVLSIGVAKIGGSLIVSHVLQNPKDVEGLTSILKNRNAKTNFNTRKTLIDFSEEDSKFEDNLLYYLSIFNSKEIVEAHNKGYWAFFEALRHTLPEERAPKGTSEVNCAYLNPSVYTLESLQSRTELYLRSTVSCLLRFIEKGGNVESLDPYDVTEFNETMGRERWNYSFPYTGVRNPSSAPLVQAVKEIRESNAKESILRKIGLLK